MSTFGTLIKKELFSGNGLFGTRRMMLFILLGIIAITVYLAYQYDSKIISYVWLVIIFLHIFVPSIYMISSLYKEERRAPLWFQLPLPGWKLLGAKYIAVAVNSIFGLVISCALFIWVYKIEISRNPDATSDLDMMMKLFRGLPQGTVYYWQEVTAFILGASFLSVIVVFIYVLTLSLKHRFGSYSWVISFLSVAGLVTLLLYFETTSVYGLLFEWGKLKEADDPLYAGGMIFSLCTFAFLMYTPAWLLDKKVEV